MLTTSTFEVWGTRKTGDGRVQVELRPTDGVSGHTTINVAEADAPPLGATIEATYTAQAAE
jgi:hypothetical protein